MTSYINLLLDSWIKFKKNLILVLPTLLSILFLIGIMALLAIEGVLIWSFSKGNLSFETIFALRNLPFLIIFGIIDLVVIFLIGSYIRAMEIGMLMDIAQKGKTSVRNMFFYGKKMMFKYLNTILLLFLIVYLPLGIIFFLLSRLATPGIIIAIILAGACLIVLSWFLIFMEPILFFKESPINIIKSTFSYGKKNFKHALVTWSIILLIGIIVNVPLSILGTIFNSGKGAFFTFLILLFNIFQEVVNIVVNLVTRLFIFKSYLVKR